MGAFQGVYYFYTERENPVVMRDANMSVKTFYTHTYVCVLSYRSALSIVFPLFTEIFSVRAREREKLTIEFFQVIEKKTFFFIHQILVYNFFFTISMFSCTFLI